LHSLDEFKELAPPELQTDEILDDEHQLVLSRLAFELAERQRSVSLAFSSALQPVTIHTTVSTGRKRNSLNRKKTN
jgi:hypothetical protein